MLKKLQLIFILGLFGSGLVACGESDSGSSEKPQSISKSTTAQSTITVATKTKGASGGELEAYDPDVPSMAVEDNGVVHEEEIYKNWPAQAAESSNDNMAVEAYDPDVPSMVVEDNSVVHEDEIYKNWPEQAASGISESVSIESAQEAPVATESKTHTVYGRATSFSPNILFINPGDTVQWQKMLSHNSVSMDGLIPEGAEPWAFKINQNGAVTLTAEGVYIYKCVPHYPLGMVAAIIVGKPVNIEQVQANATGRSKGIVIKVVKALAAR